MCPRQASPRTSQTQLRSLARCEPRLRDVARAHERAGAAIRRDASGGLRALRRFGLVFSISAIALHIGALVASAQDAQPAQQQGTAQTEFDRGTALYTAHDYAGALEAFRASASRVDSPNTRLAIARCFRELGRAPEAVAEYDRAIERGRALGPAYERTIDTATEERSALEGRVGRVEIVLPEQPAGMRVRLNERELDASELGAPIAVSPGRVEVIAEAEGFRTARFAGSVGAREQIVARLALEREEPAAPPQPGVSGAGWHEPVHEPAHPPDEGSSSTPALAWIGLGVGAAALVGSAILYFVTDAQYDTLREECVETYCADARASDLAGSGRTLELLTVVSLVLGVASLAAAGALFLLGGSDDAVSSRARASGPRPALGWRF